MGTNHLYTLLKKYRKNLCTPDEQVELERWYEQFDEEAERIGRIPEEKLTSLYQRVEEQIGRRRKRKIVRTRFSRVAVAAILLFLIGWGGNLLLHPRQSPENATISPGCYQAELILSDGSALALDSMTVVTERNGTLIKGKQQIVLDYSKLEKNLPQGMNTIRVPKGGEYSIILSDGSQVWLNSGSTLRYPVSFDNKQREVFLSGEGFFNVAKSSVPFVVKTSELNVRVLGTSFNLSAYQEDEQITTALISGQIEVSGKQMPEPYLITPGHVLTYSQNTAEVSVLPCDTDLYASWMHGEFKFRDMRLEDIMIRLNRWYNCEVFYQTPALKELRFSGAAEKDKPINYLLELIKEVTNITFEIKGHTVILKE